MPSTQISRARGCLLGQLAGDSLGSLVEFSSAEEIGGLYPGGVRKLADGGYWNTIAGQNARRRHGHKRRHLRGSAWLCVWRGCGSRTVEEMFEKLPPFS